MRVLGHHILAEFYNCNATILNNTDSIKSIMESAAAKSRATIVQSVFHRFNPHGVSGVVVIAESHLAIHTWPEYIYAAVDLFTCGNTVNPWTAFDVLKESLEAKNVTTKELKRGLPDMHPQGYDTPIRHKPVEALL